jgi:hypothetical protein
MSRSGSDLTVHSVMHLSSILSKSRLPWPRLLSQRVTFTPKEVRQRLRQDEATDPRTAAVHAAAACTSLWSALLTDKIAYDLGRTATRLPTIVFWYCQGVSAHEIGRRLSTFGGAWDADRAVDVASALIAHILNQPGFLEIIA